MKQHHTKTLGDLGVLKAQVDLYKKGFWVSIPLTEHAPFDLVITKGSQSQTVQVKTRNIDKSGVIQISFRQSYSDKNGVHTVQWDKEEIDLVCIYCPQKDECYYFNPKIFNKSLTLRVETPKNNQKTDVKFASDYREVP